MESSLTLVAKHSRFGQVKKTRRRVPLLRVVTIGFVAVCLLPVGGASSARGADADAPPASDTTSMFSLDRGDLWQGSTAGISGNPGAVNILTGTGLLGRLLGFGKDSGVRLGGLWIGDTNYLFSGGTDPKTWSFNSLLVVDLSLDLEKLVGIPGAQFGIDFLQFNGQATNDQAGVVPGYNGLPGQSPLDRSELYELWWRQRLFDDKLIFRIGKMVPTYDFNNVLRPVPVQDASLFIPATSGLIYTPIFKNPTLIGVMPGYYNSAYGIQATVAPIKNVYASYGIYDGNGARGIQTGIRAAPEFNGYYFNIGEVGAAWELGPNNLPGSAGLGGWGQFGKLSAAGVEEDGAQGFYAFGSQRLWLRSPGVDNSGVTGFVQFGINDSKTMPINRYLGAGLTGFGLIPRRPKDSMGIGVAWSTLNERLGFRSDEVMLAAYYQMHVIADIYVQPTLTHIPNPGQSPRLSPATAITTSLTILF
jgi:porin